MTAYVLLAYFCIQSEEGTMCRSSVAPIWYPTYESCTEGLTVSTHVLTTIAEKNGHKIFQNASRCLPMENPGPLPEAL